MLKWHQVWEWVPNSSESALSLHSEGSVWPRKSHHLSMKSVYA